MQNHEQERYGHNRRWEQPEEQRGGQGYSREQQGRGWERPEYERERERRGAGGYGWEREEREPWESGWGRPDYGANREREYGSPRGYDRASQSYREQQGYGRASQGPSWERQGRVWDEPDYGWERERQGAGGYGYGERQRQGWDPQGTSWGQSRSGADPGYRREPQEYGGYDQEPDARWGRPYSGGRAAEGYASGPHAGRGPKGYQRADERNQEDVCERLTKHPAIDASEIEVSVRQGEVTLSGSVESRAIKHLAETMAETVSGVKDIHNQLRVTRGQQSGRHQPPSQGQKGRTEA